MGRSSQTWAGEGRDAGSGREDGLGLGLRLSLGARLRRCLAHPLLDILGQADDPVPTEGKNDDLLADGSAKSELFQGFGGGAVRSLGCRDGLRQRLLATHRCLVLTRCARDR